jgi:hypothetical protein
MVLGWKVLLPFGFAYIIFLINIIIFLDLKMLLYQNIINSSLHSLNTIDV